MPVWWTSLIVKLLSISVLHPSESPQKGEGSMLSRGEEEHIIRGVSAVWERRERLPAHWPVEKSYRVCFLYTTPGSRVRSAKPWQKWKNLDPPTSLHVFPIYLRKAVCSQARIGALGQYKHTTQGEAIFRRTKKKGKGIQKVNPQTEEGGSCL